MHCNQGAVMQNSDPKLRILSDEPMVASLPLERINDGTMSTEAFFIRSHFPTPTIVESAWSLQVSGAVRTHLRLNFQDIKQFQPHELQVLLECAGNSRSSVTPAVDGLMWDHGGVSTAQWTGVPVRKVLELAGILQDAEEVLFEGMDRGTVDGKSGKTGFAMSLPMDKALHPDTLLAYQMNGALLSPDHGYPLRVIVPGWYGMTSVKWLTRIQVLRKPYKGYHQGDYYVYIKAGDAFDSPKKRVSSMEVKSLISSPRHGESLILGQHVVKGVAWSGDGIVESVEISIDHGETWQPARLKEPEGQYSWRHWQFIWEVHQPGYYLIIARATDGLGRRQPIRAQWNYRGFANNSSHAVPVQVRSH